MEIRYVPQLKVIQLQYLVKYANSKHWQGSEHNIVE